MTVCFYGETMPDFGYTCHIIEQKNIADPITITVKGEHWSGKSNNDVVTLYIGKCDFVTFPRNLQELFPNLKWIMIDGCNLKHIGTEHIGKWKKMRRFWVVNCQLRRLDGDIFRGLGKLKDVCFNRNNLQEIELEIVEDLKRMNNVNFFNNPNINMWYVRGSNKLFSMEELTEEIRVKCAPP
jgi:hypothetical protein